MNSILPDSVQVPHLIAFELLMQQRLDALTLDSLLVYMINSVEASALESLAWQFDLLGVKGWKLADTEQKKRALIKSAIELHRYKGTVWAVKEALRTLGFPNATITEHVGHWAKFSIQLNAGSQVVTEEQQAEIVAFVNEYKNVRSHLAGVVFEIIFDDEVILEDSSFEAPGDNEDDSVFVGGDFLYNGENYYNGDNNYSSDSDVLELTF